jgi:Peptidyl-prolyl cis-trans isomerase (rotamase) - cyclophilin family
MRKTLMIAGILLVGCGIAFGAETARKGGKPMVKLETSLGVITVELYPDKAPVSVKNFLAYVKEGHYDGLIFHRVIRDFMVQGGGFTKEMKERGSKHPPIKNEADNGLKNVRGTLAMARTSVVDSATAQFFINVVNNDFLNHRAKTPQGYGYAVFGKVTEGMDVVDKIRAVPTGNVGMFQDVPLQPVTITKGSCRSEGALRNMEVQLLVVLCHDRGPLGLHEHHRPRRRPEHEIGRAVQQECRDRYRMPSSA